MSLFKEQNPDGTDRELQRFMEAQTIETARHWRRVWQNRQGLIVTYL